MMRRGTFSVLTCILLTLPTPSFANPPARAVSGAAATRSSTGPIMVGMAQTMVAGVPEMLVGILDNRMAALMKEFAGLEGKLEVGGSPFELATKLKEDKVGLAVFQGVEFAWVRAKHPELKPLMLAVSQHKNVHAQLLVRKDAGVKSLADLRGKNLACPKKTKVHCHVFLRNACGKLEGATPKTFFGNIVHPATTEAALDELLAGKCDAVVADQYDVEFYQRVKPGNFNQLNVIDKSVAFPSAVIAYREGAQTDATLKRLHDGLLKASKSDRGQDIMAMWQITEFAPVHAEYQKALEDAVRAHPPLTEPATVGAK